MTTGGGRRPLLLGLLGLLGLLLLAVVVVVVALLLGLLLLGLLLLLPGEAASKLMGSPLGPNLPGRGNSMIWGNSE